MIFVHPQAASMLSAPDTVRKILALDGPVYRSVPGRKTVRIDERKESFFLKVHHGVGWKEILKNMV